MGEKERKVDRGRVAEGKKKTWKSNTSLETESSQTAEEHSEEQIGLDGENVSKNNAKLDRPTYTSQL